MWNYKTVGYVPELEKWVLVRKHKTKNAAEKLARSLNKRKKAVFLPSVFPYVPTKFDVEEIIGERPKKIMAKVGKTTLRLVKNPNGTITIYKGSIKDLTSDNEYEIKKRIEILKSIGYKGPRGRPPRAGIITKVSKLKSKSAIDHLRKAISDLRVLRNESKELDIKDYADKVISRIENEITNIRELL